MGTRHQTAIILLSDIQEFTKLVREDEEKAIEVLKRQRMVVEEQVVAFKGKIIHHREDKSLAYFDSSLSAAKCALNIQKELQSGSPEVKLSIGLHRGEIIFDGENVLGTSISVVSHIESIGCAGSILMSTEVYEQIKETRGLSFKSLGYFLFKDLKRPIEMYSLANEGLKVPSEDNPRSRGKRISAETLRELALEEEKKTSIWRSLWKRGVPQVLVGYLVATWTIIQFVDWLFIRYNISGVWTDILLVLFVTLVPSVLLFTYNRETINRGKLSLVDKITYPSNIILTAAMLIALFWGRDLGAMTETVTINDENGIEKEVETYKAEFINRLKIFPFVNEIREDTAWDWLGNGIMFGLNEDMSQFNYMLTEYDAEALYSQEKYTSAVKGNFLNYVDGTFRVENDTFTISYNIRETKNGNPKKGRKYSGSDFFSLLDIISKQIRLDLGLPEARLNSYPDIPIEEQITSNISAYEVFCRHINAPYFRTSEYSMPLFKAYEMDTTFSLALSLYIRWNIYFDLSIPLLRKSLIQQLFNQKSKLSDWRKREIEIMNFLVNDDRESAVEYAEDQYKIKPSIIFLKQLIRQYGLNQMVERWESALIELGKIQPEDESWKIELSRCYLLTQKPDKIKKGREQLEEYCKTHPKDISALYVLLDYYFQAGEWEAAKNTLKKIKGLSQANQWNLRDRTIKAVEYAQGNDLTEDFMKKFTGFYSPDHNTPHLSEFYVLNNIIYSKSKNQFGSFEYFDSDSSCLSNVGLDANRFLIHNGKVISAEHLEHGIPYVITFWKEDSAILKAKDYFINGYDREALNAFREAKSDNPEHYYLDYYIDHLEFKLSPEFEKYKENEDEIFGKYGEYAILEKFGQLVLQRPNKLFLMIKPLSKESFFSPDNYRYSIKITTQNGIPGIIVNYPPYNVNEEFFAKTGSTG